MVKMINQMASLRPGIMFFRFKGRIQLDLFRFQFALKLRSPIITIAQGQTFVTVKHTRGYHFLIDIGGSQSRGTDHTKPIQMNMQSKTIKSLLDHTVFAKTGFASKTTIFECSGKITHRDREAINARKSRIKDDPGQKMLLDLFLDLPEISYLPSKSSAMYLP